MFLSTLYFFGVVVSVCAVVILTAGAIITVSYLSARRKDKGGK